jgi:hypothetical protein
VIGVSRVSELPVLSRYYTALAFGKVNDQEKEHVKEGSGKHMADDN